jgi:K+-sensing histidine kinase KdpD
MITRKAMEIMNAEASSILLVDEGGKELSFKVAIGDVAEKLKDIKIEIGTGIAGWVAQSGEPLLIPDVSRDSRFFDGVDKTTGFTTKTLLCVPLKVTAKILGVVEVINKKDDSQFTDSDVDFLMAMANQAAIAIENALLYQQLTTEKNRIETILNNMSDGVIVVDEKSDIKMMNPSARRIFDLQDGKSDGSTSSPQKLQVLLNEVKQLKGNALFDIVLMKPENMILSNNVTLLKSPEGRDAGAVMVLRNVTENRSKEISRSEFLTLLAFKMFAPLEQLLRESTLIGHVLDKEELLRTAEEIENNVNIIKNLVQKLHYFSELEAGPLRMERTHYRISDLVDEAVTLSAEEFQELKIRSDIPDIMPMIRVDGGRIIEAVMLMIYFFHTTFTPEIELAIELADTEDAFITRFKNPVPGEILECVEALSASQCLIEDFCRLHSGNKGLELLEFAFVKHLLDAHGGTITIEKKPEGAFVSISLPKEKIE